MYPFLELNSLVKTALQISAARLNSKMPVAIIIHNYNILYLL